MKTLWKARAVWNIGAEPGVVGSSIRFVTQTQKPPPKGWLARNLSAHSQTRTRTLAEVSAW